jgi:hypothetical protein
MMQLIPEAVWAALLGSFLTLLGVFLTNRHHHALHLMQLKHESREEDRRRKFEARADVYLAAAAEMAKANQVLGNLSSIDFSKENPGDLLSGFVGAANQAVLIASDEAAEAINDYLSAFMAAFFHLLPRLSPLHDAKTERDIQDNLYETYRSETNRILATMTHINETGNHDTVDWDRLNSNFEFNQAKMQEAGEARSKAWDEINRLNLEFMDDMVDQSKNMARSVLPALVAIRADLDISTNLDLYRRQLEKRLALLEELIGDFKTALGQTAPT